MAAPARPRGRTILFVLQHPGYLRPYISAIDILRARGHRVLVAFAERARNDADRRLERRLPAGVDLGLAVQRDGDDGWGAVALAVRTLADAARYTDPRFRGASKLRLRATNKARGRLRGAGCYGTLGLLVGSVLVRLLARVTSARFARWSRRAAAWLESGIPSAAPIERVLAEHSPDVVVASPLVEFGSRQVDYLKSARRLGKATVVAVSSWDNLTNKGLIRFDPDRVIVWNRAQREEAAAMHGISPDRVVATGAQRFDPWFERTPAEPADELRRRAGLDPERPFVLYVCSSAFVTRDEVPFVERWLERLRADERLRGVGVMIRPYPKHAQQWDDADMGRFDNVVVWPASGTEPDAGEARETFFDSLAHAAAVVGINTSVLLEAAILGKPVLVPVLRDFEATQIGTLHFHHLLEENGGFLQVASDLDQHVAQLRDAIDDPRSRAAVAARFVEWFLRPNGLGVPAAPLVADAIETATPGADATGDALLPRLLLTPLAAIWSRRARTAAGGEGAALEPAEDA